MTTDMWTDFNDIQDGNQVTVSLAHCHVVPRAGEAYTFGDGEGNWCRGTVEWIHNTYLTARLDLTTWHNAGEDPRLAETLSDPTIAAEVDRIVEETRRDDEEGK